MKTRVSLAVLCGSLLAVGATTLAAPVAAQEDEDLSVLRREIEDLRRIYDERLRAMDALEARIRGLEARESAPQPRVWTATTTLEPEPPTRRRAERRLAQGDDQPKQVPSGSGDEQRREPANQGVEALVAEEHALFGRRFTIDPGITYARFDRAQINLNGFLALDAIFLGNISVDDIESDIITYDVAFRYGVTDRLQVNVDVPYVWRTTNFQSGGAGGAAAGQIEASVSEGPSLGDVSMGASYRVIAESTSIPDIVVSLSAKAPTGSDPFGIETVEVEGSQGNLTVPEELPTGSGIWGISGGISILKTYDPAVFFSSITYFHNLETSFDDIDSAVGDQPGDIRLGDAIQFGMGFAVALNERSSMSLSYSQRITEETFTRADGQERFNEVIGSNSNVATLNIGLTFAAADFLSIVGNVGAGLTVDAPDVQAGLRFPMSF